MAEIDVLVMPQFSGATAADSSYGAAKHCHSAQSVAFDHCSYSCQGSTSLFVSGIHLVSLDMPAEPDAESRTGSAVQPLGVKRLRREPAGVAHVGDEAPISSAGALMCNVTDSRIAEA